MVRSSEIKCTVHTHVHILKWRKCAVPEVEMLEVATLSELTSIDFRHIKTCVFRVLSMFK